MGSVGWRAESAQATVAREPIYTRNGMARTRRSSLAMAPMRSKICYFWAVGWVDGFGVGRSLMMTKQPPPPSIPDESTHPPTHPRHPRHACTYLIEQRAPAEEPDAWVPVLSLLHKVGHLPEQRELLRCHGGERPDVFEGGWGAWGG